MPDPADPDPEYRENPALRVHRFFRLKLEVARSPVRRWTFSLLCVGLGVGALVIPDGHARARALAPGVALVLFGGCLPVVAPRRRGRLAGKIALLPPMCAVCGCDMRGVYPDRGGVADCPRCGAGWRLAAPLAPQSRPPKGCA
jgi:hypothetical protein